MSNGNLTVIASNAEKSNTANAIAQHIQMLLNGLLLRRLRRKCSKQKRNGAITMYDEKYTIRQVVEEIRNLCGRSNSDCDRCVLVNTGLCGGYLHLLDVDKTVDALEEALYFDL